MFSKNSSKPSTPSTNQQKEMSSNQNLNLQEEKPKTFQPQSQSNNPQFQEPTNQYQKQQTQQQQQQPEKPKGKMFKGMNVKKTAQPGDIQEPQSKFDDSNLEASQSESIHTNVYSSELYNKVQPQQSQEILNDETSQQIYHQQLIKAQYGNETPQPEYVETPTQQVDSSSSSVKKKPAGFGFLKKNKPQSDILVEQVNSPSANVVDSQDTISDIKENSCEKPNTTTFSWGSNHQQSESETPGQINLNKEDQIQENIPEEQKMGDLKIEQQKKKQEFKQLSSEKDESLAQANNSFKSKLKQKPIKQEHEKQKNDSIYRQQYQEIIQELDVFEKQLNTQLAKIYVQQQHCEIKKVSLKQLFGQISQNISQQTIEQQTCLEADLYDKADDIQKEIDRMNEQMSKANTELNDITKLLSNLDEEKDKLRITEGPFYQSISKKCSEVEQKYSKFTDEYNYEQQAILKKLLTQIDEENERVKITQIHVDIDCKHLDEEEDHLKTLMNVQTKEYRNEQQALISKKEDLDLELQALRKQIQDKQGELDNVQEELQDVNSKIFGVQQKFSQQLQKVEKKKEKFNEEIDQLQRERQQIAVFENECERKKNDLTLRLETLSSYLNNMSGKRTQLEERANDIIDGLQKVRQINEQYQIADAKTQVSFSALQHIERQIDNVNFKKSLNQQQLNDLINLQSELQLKLPKLVDEKTNLITNKNFKGAQIVNSQIKETQLQVENCENKIKQSNQQETQLIQQTDQFELEKQSLLEKYESDNFISEFKKYYVLQVRLEDMEQLIQWIVDPIEKSSFKTQINQCLQEKDNLFQVYQEKIVMNQQLNESKQQDIGDPKVIQDDSQQIQVSDKDSDQDTPKQIISNKSVDGAKKLCANDENSDLNQNDKIQDGKAQNDDQNQIDQNPCDEENSLEKQTSDQEESQEKKVSRISDLIEQFKTVSENLSQIEAEMTELANQEKYDEADELNEKFQNTQFLLEKINEQFSFSGLASIQEAQQWVNDIQ